MVNRVFIVRHGETDFNAEKRWQGFMPTPLNQVGQNQAKRLAQYLQNELIDMIISSDLRRAIETVQPTADSLGLDIKLDERLRELNLGIFQGLTGEEIQTKFPEEWTAWRTDYMTYTIPNGESRHMLQSRVYEAWLDLTENVQFNTLLLMTHGGTIRMLLQAVLGDGEWMYTDFSNTSITVLEKLDEHWTITQLATTAHLNA